MEGVREGHVIWSHLCPFLPTVSLCPGSVLGQSWVSWGLRRMEVWALEPPQPCPEFLCSWPSRTHNQGDTRQHFRALAEGPHPRLALPAPA